MEKEKKPVFPLCIFPAELKKIVKETHRDLNYPENYTAASMFLAISLAIGRTRVLEVRKGWRNLCILFMALLGKTGSVKSHPIAFALAPFFELDNTTLAEYETELIEYKSIQQDVRGSKPHAKQFVVQDITLEGLGRVHKDNPRGLCTYNDELKGWIANFNRYRKSGGDAQKWLEIFNGGRLVVNRKTQDEITFLPASFIDVIGGLQPEILPHLFRGEMTDNGFLYRVLFVNNPDEDAPLLWTGEDLPTDSEDTWRAFIMRTLKICGYFDGNNTEVVYRFNEDAWSLIRDWQHRSELRLHDEGSDSEIAIFRKIQSYALRFCLVIHTIREVSGEISPSTTVDDKTALLSTILADYFYATAQQVRDYILRGGEDPSPFFLFLNALNDEFTTNQAISVAAKIGISRRTVFRYLEENEGLFIARLRHGVYKKM